MARTDAAAALTEQQRTRQATLRAATLRDFVELWPQWSLDDPGSMNDMAAAAATLARESHRDSAVLAGSYFEDFRRAENVDGQAQARLADRLDRREAQEAIRGAGLSGAVNARRRGSAMREAMRNGLVKASGAMAQLTLSGGRQTITQSVQADRQARGWTRVTAGNPCAFCAMLASRGAAYRGQSSAGFQAHNHCRCVAEPAYSGSQMPQRNQQFRDLWDEATAGQRDQLNAFRRALESAGA